MSGAAAGRRPGTWPEGTSGNPGGRPPGARNKAPAELGALLRRAGERHARAIVGTLVDAAKGGDVQAAAALLDAITRTGGGAARGGEGGPVRGR